MTHQGAPLLSFDSWDFWWENNKDRFLELKSRLNTANMVTGSISFATGRGRKTRSSGTRRPDRLMVDTEIIPALLQLLAEESDADILDSTLLALARTTDATFASQVADAANELLSHPKLSVRTSAALSLGVLGSETSTQLLVDIASDNSAGKRAVGGGSPHFLVRSFAAISLGLIADPDGVDTLMAVIDELSDSDFEIKVGAIVALGLLGPDHIRADDARGFLETALVDRKLNELIKSFIPTSLGKLGKRDSVPALLATFVDRDTGRSVRQSAAIGLGQIAEMADTEVVELLLDYVEAGRDAQTRHFALISLGEIGARDERPHDHAELHERLTRQFQTEIRKRGKSQQHRSWAALAGALYAREHAAAQPELIEQILAAYEKESDLAYKGGFAIALGLLGSKAAGDTLWEDYQDSADQTFRGYVAVALGFIQYFDASEVLRRQVQDKTITPTFRLQVATALGLMSDAEAVPVLVDTLANARTLGVSSAVAKALGLIGDRDSIGRLKGIAQDERRQKITRAFACVALGIVGERTDLPWNAAISANNNYRAKVSSIEEVLDIL
ncbi:MAG: hypothetical protein DHS20C15_10580 [Planctomycetota bacterium]|nr:MAG: hypothetical protein DHS20C15_10580 [Planctomycetota bacterium]